MENVECTCMFCSLGNWSGVTRRFKSRVGLHLSQIHLQLTSRFACVSMTGKVFDFTAASPNLLSTFMGVGPMESRLITPFNEISYCQNRDLSSFQYPRVSYARGQQTGTKFQSS